MSKDEKSVAQADTRTEDAEAKARREFLKTVAESTAKGLTVAPAVAMLLAAVSRPRKALAAYQDPYGGGGGCGCGGGSILTN